jgi:hypothetical protein
MNPLFGVRVRRLQHGGGDRGPAEEPEAVFDPIEHDHPLRGVEVPGHLYVTENIRLIFVFL